MTSISIRNTLGTAENPSSSFANAVCQQCSNTFRSTAKLDVHGFHTFPFHSRPWALLEDNKKASHCSFCSFLMAVVKSTRGAEQRSIDGDPLATNMVSTLRISPTFDEHGAFTSYRIEVIGMQDSTRKFYLGSMKLFRCDGMLTPSYTIS